MKASTTEGPARSAIAAPVRTNNPAPMIAPMPSMIRLTGPSVRFRVCSPASPASLSSVSSGFFANKGLPMQLLLCCNGPSHNSRSAAVGQTRFLQLTAMPDVKLDSHIVGAAPSAPYQKLFRQRSPHDCTALPRYNLRGLGLLSRPQPVHRQS